jgi:hypothetical protein
MAPPGGDGRLRASPADGACPPKVISASRRVDMVAGYREELMDILERDWPPERVHTVVLWTKSPPALLRDSTLKTFLLRYDQVFLHLTMTGLGGSILEPRAPTWSDSAAALSGLVDFAGSPERIRLRFDPLLEVQTPSGVLSNLRLFEDVAGAGLKCGINNISISWATSYGKVSSRLKPRGMKFISKSEEEMKELWDGLYSRAESMGVVLHACCVPGLSRSRCIDGDLLARLHPKAVHVSTKRAKGQRPLCECTESFDIGWYRSCPTGCLYCYGNPALIP